MKNRIIDDKTLGKPTGYSPISLDIPELVEVAVQTVALNLFMQANVNSGKPVSVQLKGGKRILVNNQNNNRYGHGL